MDVEASHVTLGRQLLLPRHQRVASRGLPTNALGSPGVVFARIVGVPNMRQRATIGHNWKRFLLFFCETIVLITLKLYFIYHVVKFVHSLPTFSMSTLNTKLADLCEALLSLCAVAGADAMWSNKDCIKRLLGGHYISPSNNGFWKRFQVGFLPYFLFLHSIFGISLFFSANVCQWSKQAIADCSVSDIFTSFLVVKVLAIAQVYITMTVYTVLCLYVESSLSDIATVIGRDGKNMDYRDLQAVHLKYERCSKFLDELTDTFLGYIFFWYIYLFCRAFYIVNALFGLIRNTQVVSGQDLSVPAFELSFLLILCLLSEKMKLTIADPAKDIQDIIISRTTKETELHIECQRFLHRIERYASLTLWKFSSWIDTILRAGGIFILSMIVLQVDVKDLKLKKEFF